MQVPNNPRQISKRNDPSGPLKSEFTSAGKVLLIAIPLLVLSAIGVYFFLNSADRQRQVEFAEWQEERVAILECLKENTAEIDNTGVKDRIEEIGNTLSIFSGSSPQRNLDRYDKLVSDHIADIEKYHNIQLQKCNR